LWKLVFPRLGIVEIPKVSELPINKKLSLSSPFYWRYQRWTCIL